MFHDLVGEPAAEDPSALSAAYVDRLREIVDAVGRAELVASHDVDQGSLDALEVDWGDVAFEAACAVLAATVEGIDGETLRREALDELLLGMTAAVLDVDTLAATVDLDVSPTGLQGRIEGRVPMTLEEYAHVRSAIERRRP